jgi:hypothetical protein
MMTQTTSEGTREGGGKVMTVIGVADQSIDDVGQTPIRDLRHQFGEETDLVHQPQEEIGHVHQSQEEIDPDHLLRGEIGQRRLLGDEILLIDRKDGDQHHQRNAEEADQTGNPSICEHGGGILLQSNLDHHHQRDTGGRLIDGLLILQVGAIETIETMERMGGDMIIGGMAVVMKEGMIEEHRRIPGRTIQKTERQSDNRS